MSNATLNALLELPAFLKRHLIFHSEGFNVGIEWIDRLIRTFESNKAINSITYPVTLYLESACYSGELEVRRDGSHAVRINH